MQVAEDIWAEVDSWPRFAKNTMGTQIVRSADSIAANIGEGHGRYHDGNRCTFCYYSRGSLQETITWLQKANNRQLISDDRFTQLSADLVTVRRLLNGYIRFLKRRPH
jgi:four helix bundle protein